MLLHLKNTKHHYGFVAVILHWLIAILIIGMLALGLYMTGLVFSLWKLQLYGWHKEFGILVLMLAIIRIAWRFSNITPAFADYLPRWQKIAARSMHFILYLFMFAMPLTGWMLSSTAGLPVSFFGWLILPDLLPANETLRIFFSFLHEWLGYGLIICITIHIAAVLQHYLIYKDNLLRRMWP